ncbi:LysM peptidoglycan-binding domain-containing protein [Thiocystis violacea]|uniref:LysM peptidoglycan-binding domain-containing protein n=1 Tax=Thiocystis violacea TaxID=13725 RepID=UPI001905256C
MHHQRSASRINRLALLAVLSLSGVIAWLPASAQSEPVTQTAETPDPTLETLDQLHKQLQELRQRVRGMDGKLKDSARARKAADQARMEAERRLAEGTQALEGVRSRLEELQSTQAAMEQQLSDQQGVIDRLAMELASERDKSQDLTRELDSLREQLPEAEGGALTADAAREAATAAFVALQDQMERSGSDRNADRVQSIADAEAQLHRMQLKLARVLNARSVYNVRPKDSLALISNRFYGTSAEWRTLFAANRHVLSNPDQLAPGMTLIIP